MRPIFTALYTAAARSETPSLRKDLSRWVFTVAVETKHVAAISSFDNPRDTSERISLSRCERVEISKFAQAEARSRSREVGAVGGRASTFDVVEAYSAVNTTTRRVRGIDAAEANTRSSQTQSEADSKSPEVGDGHSV